MKTVSVVGLGNRGTEYMGFISRFHSRKMQIYAVCDTRRQALDDIAPKFGIPENLRFNTDEDFFSAGVLSDALIISTQDASHFEVAKAAIECGYKYIMLEKPVSAVRSEYLELQRLANENGVLLVVCHVLRYSNYYSKIKQIIASGAIGDLISVNHTENVGYFHFAHSYVRGNWRNENTATPSILAKCCHDLDLISWFADSPCVSVSSVGKLNYFRPENAPAGATPTCMGGCTAKKQCPYDAERLYITDPFYKAKFIKFMKRTITGKAGSSKRDVVDAIRMGDYGKCVFMNDNNVCDSQTVTMKFENGAVGVLNMNAFSDKMYRSSHICGTKGELIGSGTKLEMRLFGGEARRIHTGSIGIGGHIEGDVRLVSFFVKAVTDEITDLKGVTTIDATIESHDLALACEISRKTGGKPVTLPFCVAEESEAVT